MREEKLEILHAKFGIENNHQYKASRKASSS